MRLSYAITVVNELEEIQKLLPFLFKHSNPQDEIVVLFDENGLEIVWGYLLDLKNEMPPNFIIKRDNFQKDFSEWKNKLNKLCSGDYILNIDADEFTSVKFIKDLPTILQDNPDIDVFALPRINIVEGITPEHIKKWNWNVNKKGYINYPDLQIRLYKNKPEIHWTNKVHEMLLGFKTFAVFDEEEYALNHYKTIERQEKQNNFYSNL